MNKRLILFGFGNVGGGFYRIFRSVQSPLPVELIAVVVKHKEKHANLPSDLLHAYDETTWHPAWEKADVVIECTSDPVAGWDIIFSSLRAGKAVITSSKRPLAENLAILDSWLREHPEAVLRYEAAAVASLPVFGGILGHFTSEKAQELLGVVNGTTHYILSRMLKEGTSYEKALREAQRLGYAEEDPYLDVSGWDAAYKFILLSWRFFQVVISPSALSLWGITGFSESEHLVCQTHRLLLKPVAYARVKEDLLEVYVGPAFLPAEHALGRLEGAENGLLLRWAWAGWQFYQGMGAGPDATGSAILGDLAAVLNKARYAGPLSGSKLTVAGLEGTFYLRGDRLLSQVKSPITPIGEGVLWQGRADDLYRLCCELPPESYFVALVPTELTLALSYPFRGYWQVFQP
ncbi:MAG: homoserine dehydrogenase [Bacteroidia bacterium]|nr:homoserine dehydrogenase [Bacteroidia bacterium]